MEERPVKVRCHGEVKRLRLRRNLNNIRTAIRQGFGIPANAEITLSIVSEGNDSLPLTNDQVLQNNWNGLRELQVTLSLRVQRAMVNPQHLQTVIEGRTYRIDEPPSRNSQVVRKFRSEMGIMENIAEFKNMFPRTCTLVEELYRSVRVLKTSAMANRNILVSKSKSVVKSLVDIFEKSEIAFDSLIEMCTNVTTVLQQLNLDLVDGDHQAAVGSLDMLMRKGNEMEKITQKLDCSIELSMPKIDGAIQTIANERKATERNVQSTEREKRRTEDNVRQQSEEICNLELKLTEYRSEADKKAINATISGTTTGVGAALTLGGVLFPPLLLVGIPTLVGSSIYLGVTVEQIKDLEKEITAARDKKGREERRKQELKGNLSELNSDLNKLEPIVDCLLDVWGQMVKIKATVRKMESFWPGLNDFCTTMMASERRMISVMKSDNKQNPLHLSDAFKSQIMNFSARSVALLEVCKSCHSDVRTSLRSLRAYQHRF